MTVTTPVTLMLLVRAALSRDIQEGRVELEQAGSTRSPEDPPSEPADG
jgi:multisubunit Na+/H+ antiporter MnhG subunit